MSESEFVPFIDKKLIIHLYRQGHGYADIARIVGGKYGVSRQYIYMIVNSYYNTGKKGNLRADKYNNMKECEMCNEEAVALHHIDRNNKNDKPKNLLPVCKKCHYKLHRGEKRKINFWSQKYTKCIQCDLSSSPHQGKGLCRKCAYKNRVLHK